MRAWPTYTYFLITIITCIQAMMGSSFRVGASALVACCLCFFGTAGVVGSYRARREKNYGTRDLAGIGAIGVTLVVAGLGLINWAGFWIGLVGVTIGGPLWCVIGVVIAVLITSKEHALT